MVICRLASARELVTRIESRLSPGNPTKNTANRHTNPSEIAFAEHVSRHDLTSSEHVRRGGAVDHKEMSRRINLDAEIRKRNARSQRIPVEWRNSEGPRPVRFWRRHAFSSTIILNGRIKCSRTAGCIESLHYRP